MKDNRYLILKYLIDKKATVNGCAINDLLKTLDLTPLKISEALQLLEVDGLIRTIPRSHFELRSPSNQNFNSLDKIEILALITPAGEKLFNDTYETKRNSFLKLIAKYWWAIILPIFIGIILLAIEYKWFVRK